MASVIARVFPAHKPFVDRVVAMFASFASELKFGPYPGDKLVYRSGRMVEYSTPPNTEGLGTFFDLRPNGVSIDGVAILQGDTPDLVMLNMRLPPNLKALEGPIRADVEGWGGRAGR